MKRQAGEVGRGSSVFVYHSYLFYSYVYRKSVRASLMEPCGCEVAVDTARVRNGLTTGVFYERSSVTPIGSLFPRLANKRG